MRFPRFTMSYFMPPNMKCAVKNLKKHTNKGLLASKATQIKKNSLNLQLRTDCFLLTWKI